MRCKHPTLFERACHPRQLGCHGSAAAEFALAAPVVVLIAVGIADFGMLAAKSAALASATSIGAQYARVYSLDVNGIRRAAQSAMSFSPGLSFPASFPWRCECDDTGAIACSESCATLGRPGPNRVFITVSASQPVSPFVPWPGIPATLVAATEVRLQ